MHKMGDKKGNQTVEAVQNMQNYIREHLEDEMSVEEVTRASGYSRRHALRLFRGLTGQTVRDYIRALRLTAAARELSDGTAGVLEIALNHQYQSHEGFTKAFTEYFGVTPRQYRREQMPLAYFVAYPVKHYFMALEWQRSKMMRPNKLLFCTVTILRLPQRSLIFLPSRRATEYWSYCEEVGCQWEGLLNSIPERLQDAGIVTLPRALVPQGMSACAAGVEVPDGYDKPLPDGYRVVSLKAGDMMFFQTSPFEREEDFCQAIDTLTNAQVQYDPTLYGYEYALDEAPAYQFGASAQKGARMAMPVRKRR